MRIEENRVFMFTFDTGEMGNIAIPVRSDSREGAASSLQAMFARMQTELAMEFPKVANAVSPAPGAVMPMPEGAELADMPPDMSGILLERIDSLMNTLGATGLTMDAKAKTIKAWTEVEFIPANYTAIVHELELLASGGKEMPVKGKKK